MKKISFVSAIVLAAVSLVGINPAQAKDEHVVAIIDSYFDPSISATHICVADFGCNLRPSNTSSPVFSHGTQMASIVSRHNPDAKLILIRAGSISGSTLGDANAREISNALLAVPAHADVISISIFSNNSKNSRGTDCRPSNSLGYSVPRGATHRPVNVSNELTRTTNAVSAIVSSGRAVLASAGNADLPNGLNYPACVTSVTSVTIPFATGTANPGLDIYLNTNGDTLNGDLATTSGATAFIASKFGQYRPTLSTSKNVVSVLP